MFACFIRHKMPQNGGCKQAQCKNVSSKCDSLTEVGKRGHFLGRGAYITEFWLALPDSLLKMYIKTCWQKCKHRIVNREAKTLQKCPKGSWTMHAIGPWPLDVGRQGSFTRNPGVQGEGKRGRLAQNLHILGLRSAALLLFYASIRDSLRRKVTYGFRQGKFVTEHFSNA